jgi:predicted RNA-binding protein YlxR (DUF448 family)
VGCKTVLPKRSLVRIVRTLEGIQIDFNGKLPGRGAYLHELQSCWDVGINGALSRSLRTKLSSDDLDHLRAFMERLPTDIQNEGS